MSRVSMRMSMSGYLLKLARVTSFTSIIALLGLLLVRSGSSRGIRISRHNIRSTTTSTSLIMGFLGQEIFPVPRRRRAHQNIMRDVDPPRASCDTILNPAVYSDFRFGRYPSADTPGPSTVSYGPSSAAGPSSFVQPYHQHTSFFPLGGFHLFAHPSQSGSSNPVSRGFGPRVSSRFFTHVTEGEIQGGSSFTTPSANVFPLFQPQQSGSMRNLQRPYLSGFRSRVDDDDDEDDGDDDDGDDRESEGNEEIDDTVNAPRAPQPRRGIRVLRHLLLLKNWRRPGCGTD